MKRFSIPAFLLFASLALTAYTPMPTPDFSHTELHDAADRCDAVKAKETFDPKTFDQVDREGYTPLGYAARSGCLEVAKFLVEKGARVDASEEHSRWTPLHQAAYQKHTEMVSFLLEKGADIHAATARGDTPVKLAMRQSTFKYGPEGNWVETVKVLLKKGADASYIFQLLDEYQAYIDKQSDRIRELEGNVAHLNEELEKIRSVAGDGNTYRPT